MYLLPNLFCLLVLRHAVPFFAWLLQKDFPLSCTKLNIDFCLINCFTILSLSGFLFLCRRFCFSLHTFYKTNFFLAVLYSIFVECIENCITFYFVPKKLIFTFSYKLHGVVHVMYSHKLLHVVLVLFFFLLLDEH